MLMANDDTTLSMLLEGHLTREALDSAIVSIEPRLSVERPAVLVVDALRMTSYDGTARERFVEFAKQHRAAIKQFVILTERRLWRVVISAMSLASGMPMVVYPSREEYSQARADEPNVRDRP